MTFQDHFGNPGRWPCASGRMRRRQEGAATKPRPRSSSASAPPKTSPAATAASAPTKKSAAASAARSTRDPKNAIIQDLSLAPVNARGMVEYSADFVMLKPKDMSKASGVLRYDAPNRGNILTMVNPAATPSDAVFLERGYVLLYSAWQGDVPKSSPARLTVTVPVAKNKDGSLITGTYRSELIPRRPRR
jgi:hypothetical protein